MIREEFELLVELALAVHAMVPPDRQRSITRKFDAMEAAHRRDEARMMPAALPPRFFAVLLAVLDQAHAALRTVDASDAFHATCPSCGAGVDVIPHPDRVTDAIAAIEEFARERGIKLGEK